MCACEREVCLRFVWVCVRELLFCAVVVCLSHVELSGLVRACVLSVVEIDGSPCVSLHC